mmetsp:Transcript_8430/g.9680  ORF Transcript_8430/g.9680 Transcript_8430/m.9680 type:complete len:227 (+) Transcript_8430:51-731(+)
MNVLLRRCVTRNILQPRQLNLKVLDALDVQLRDITIAAFVGWEGETKTIMHATTTMIIRNKNEINFHSSTQVLLAVRRRRRGAKNVWKSTENLTSNDESTETTLQRRHAPVNSKEFYQSASEFLDQLEEAVEAMKIVNDFFITKRSRGDLGEIFTIDLGPKEGLYTVEISEMEHVFEYTSPISGKLLYCLSSITNTWINIDDGHQFEGILVRDLIRSNCLGLPKFP